MVIGENVDAQLEPFWEELEVEEYMVDMVLEEDKERVLKFYTDKGENFDSFEDCYRKYGEDWNNNRYKKDKDGVWREYSKYNPDAQWDWYQIGGRWAGKIIVKEGVKFDAPCFSWGWSQEAIDQRLKERRTDSALLKDIENIDDSFYTCYAVLKDGEWISDGGGIDAEKVKDIVSKLSPNTRITFVDCHM